MCASATTPLPGINCATHSFGQKPHHVRFRALRPNAYRSATPCLGNSRPAWADDGRVCQQQRAATGPALELSAYCDERGAGVAAKSKKPRIASGLAPRGVSQARITGNQYALSHLGHDPQSPRPQGNTTAATVSGCNQSRIGGYGFLLALAGEKTPTRILLMFSTNLSACQHVFHLLIQ